MLLKRRKTELPTATEALPGRATPIPTDTHHFVLGAPLKSPYPQGMARAMFGLGCFWGAEKRFWSLHGVYTTAVGYAGGLTPNPTYEEVCTGLTGHNEVVLVVYDPARIGYDALLRAFFEAHDPTQGMRQGNDVGTQYRSGIYVCDAAQRETAEAMLAAYQQRLQTAGYGAITTEILDAPEFYFAEGYHQQYLAKNPHGYCGLGGTGVTCG
jgi:peptide-methionine (S)-S-oxide reductase